MKSKLNAILFCLFPILLHAQENDHRTDPVILPQELATQYKSLHENLNATDGRVSKLRQAREEIKRKYAGNLDAPDVKVMLADLDNQEQQLETERKAWKEQLEKAESGIRDIIRDAHGKPVEWRAYNANPVEKLGTLITTTFSVQDGQIVTVDSYYQLPDPAAHP